MCLLERVVHWDEQRVVCCTTSHRSPTNPLRRDGRLGAVHAVEYGAQAIAVHRSLTGGGTSLSSIAFLASLRDVVIRVPRLDGLPGELEITAERLVGFGLGAMYRFAVHADGMPVCDGRAGVMEARPGP